MLFVGVDLTSAFAKSPRANDVAVLDDNLNCRLAQAEWPDAACVVARNPSALRKMIAEAVGSADEQVWAIDGPQGLSSTGQTMRHCERILGTPGRTPEGLPPAQPGGRPFGDYIRSSIDLFAALAASQPALVMAGNIGSATLFEVFPGAEWRVLGGKTLPKKTSAAGRTTRRALLSALGIQGVPALPTADENDALVAAYLVWCTRHAASKVVLRGSPPSVSGGEVREGYILHFDSGAAVDRGQLELPEAQARPVDVPVESEDEDWGSSEGLVLKLIDYGVVHGSCPENGWLQSGETYTCRTLAPDPVEQFRLTHSPTFSGGRGWKLDPSAKQLLTKLGYATPSHLGESNAVTLRIQLAQET
jgi:hypothetical protein